MLPGLPSFQPITRHEKNLGKGRQTGEGKAYSEIVARVHPLAGHTTAYDESPVEGYEKGNQHGDYWRSSSIQEKKRPTYIKVHRKYLSPDTLDHFALPWEWDKASLFHQLCSIVCRDNDPY